MRIRRGNGGGTKNLKKKTIALRGDIGRVKMSLLDMVTALMAAPDYKRFIDQLDRWTDVSIESHFREQVQMAIDCNNTGPTESLNEITEITGS